MCPQRAMRHASPETKQGYELGMVEQVRKNIERANRRVYRASKVHTFMTLRRLPKTWKQTRRVNERWGKWRARGDSNSRPSGS